MEVIYSKEALRNIKKIPQHIRIKILYWIDFLNEIGLPAARAYKGFNDEALLGSRKGQRSVRLSKSYRLFYRELPCEHTIIIEILEVNKHDY